MRPFLLPLLALVALHCAHAPEPPASAAPPAATPSWPEPQPPALRLGEAVRPVHYLLDLTLLPSEPTYSGTVTVDLDVREPTRQVWLHAQDLEITQARVLSGGRAVEARPVTASEGRLGVLLAEPLSPGHAQLILSFQGHTDRERSQGLYSVEEGGQPYLYTFFEPIDARRAFPCFDEPGFKVPWVLRFTVKQEHVALANSPIASEEPLAGGLKRVTFAESRPMPSYLVAFVVGPFDLVEGSPIGRNHVPLRFIVPKGRGAETAYAVKVTPRIITLLEDFFDQPYPYEKLDVAVVPRYWGTMEHPGIVALGQPLTLIRPGEETVMRRRAYANIAIHELGHYWFGDVVTCRWWDDIWLNESLTSWLDTKITDQFEPSWNFALDGQANSLAFALQVDSLTATPPLRKPITTNDDIIGSFDNGTTYAKGASLLNMLQGWRGLEPVRDMLRAHVREHAWGVATTEDFVATIGKTLGPDTAHVFQSFIEQPGAPRISAALECKAGAQPVLKLSQERFLPAGSPGSKAQKWNVPVCARAGRGKDTTRACTVLSAETGELPLSLSGCPTWVLLNAEGTGYYRSGYTREQLSPLWATPAGTLTISERLTLLGDVKAGVDRGDVLLGEALKMVPSTASDPSSLVLDGGLQLLFSVHISLLPEADQQRFRKWVRTLYGPRARALGWKSSPGESDEVKELRWQLLSLAAGMGQDPALSQEAGRLAKAWLADRKAVDLELARPALQIAVRKGDTNLFEQILAQARKEQDRNERAELLGLLGGFQDPALAKRALTLVAGDEFDVRDTQRILQGALYRPETRALAWEFYQQNFDKFASRLRSDEVGRLIGITRVFCEESQRAEAEALLKPRVAQIEGGPRELTRSLEAIRVCVESERRNQPSVLEFLRHL
ncbi:M1 family metallopeptidase [Hyalangium versicolor]|uniref:M1 family metallopeptidase n=1 Tax=Hyalangium versicolor TaxID=2861190 RepID=UPI001CCD5587|nr:M1 family metallopeptidase [Hyalangium versicolor]